MKYKLLALCVLAAALACYADIAPYPSPYPCCPAFILLFAALAIGAFYARRD